MIRAFAITTVLTIAGLAHAQNPPTDPDKMNKPPVSPTEVSTPASNPAGGALKVHKKPIHPSKMKVPKKPDADSTK